MANVPRRKGSNVTTKTTIARFIYYCKGFDLILELNAFVASNMLHLSAHVVGEIKPFYDRFSSENKPDEVVFFRSVSELWIIYPVGNINFKLGNKLDF